MKTENIIYITLNCTGMTVATFVVVLPLSNWQQRLLHSDSLMFDMQTERMVSGSLHRLDTVRVILGDIKVSLFT